MKFREYLRKKGIQRGAGGISPSSLICTSYSTCTLREFTVHCFAVTKASSKIETKILDRNLTRPIKYYCQLHTKHNYCVTCKLSHGKGSSEVGNMPVCVCKQEVRLISTDELVTYTRTHTCSALFIIMIKCLRNCKHVLN